MAREERPERVYYASVRRTGGIRQREGQVWRSGFSQFSGKPWQERFCGVAHAALLNGENTSYLSPDAFLPHSLGSLNRCQAAHDLAFTFIKARGKRIAAA